MSRSISRARPRGPAAYSHSMVRFPVNSRLPDSSSRLANFEFPVRGCANFLMILKSLILFEVWAMKIGKFPLNFPIYGNFSIRRCSWSGRGSKGKSAQQSGICGTAIGTLLNSPDRASFGDRGHGAGNRSAGPLCGGTPLPGSAGGHHQASQGVHRRHGRGGDLRRRPAVEPDRHRLCRAHRPRRQKPYPRDQADPRCRRPRRRSPTAPWPTASSSTA